MNSRKRKRNKELKQRKLAKKAAKGMSNQVSEALSKMPKACDECSAPFNREDKSTLEWRIAVYDDGRVNLVCPGCVPDEVKKQS